MRLFFLSFFILVGYFGYAQVTDRFDFEATYVADETDTITVYVQKKGQKVMLDPSLIVDDSMDVSLVILDFGEEKMVVGGKVENMLTDMYVSMNFDQFLGSSEILNEEEKEIVEFKKTDETMIFQGETHHYYKVDIEDYGLLVVDESFEYNLSPFLNKVSQSEGENEEIILPTGLIIELGDDNETFIKLIKLEPAEIEVSYTINMEL